MLSKKRCAECGDSTRPRGKWSPYFCAPCDLARMKGLDRDFRALSESIGRPYVDVDLDAVAKRRNAQRRPPLRPRGNG